MANPTLPHPTQRRDWDGEHLEVEGIIVDDKVVISTQKVLVADAPAGGAGATAGAYDTAANRDLMIAALNNVIAVLKDHGLMADA